jgi:hypothetical protein
MMDALATHICQVHRRAGFVLARAMGDIGMAGDRTRDQPDGPSPVARSALEGVSLPPATLDHPAIAHKRSDGAPAQRWHKAGFTPSRGRRVIVWPPSARRPSAVQILAHAAVSPRSHRG